MRLGSHYLSLGPAASRGGATSHLGCPLALCSQKLEGNFPGWQVNPGGSQRRHLWLSQKLQVPGLPTSVLFCLPPFPSLSGTPDWILALSNFVHYFNGHMLSMLCVPGLVLAAGDTNTELALAALDGGAGCSLHKNIQLGSEGLRKGNLFEIHTKYPITLSGGPDPAASLPAPNLCLHPLSLFCMYLPPIYHFFLCVS